MLFFAKELIRPKRGGSGAHGNSFIQNTRYLRQTGTHSSKILGIWGKRELIHPKYSVFEANENSFIQNTRYLRQAGTYSS